MPLSTSFVQSSLVVTLLTSSFGTYIALSPPNPSTNTEPATNDSIHRLKLTRKHSMKIMLAPLGLLALYTSCLILLHPKIPPSILRNGAANHLNTDLITWSAATSIPLALLLCVGIPLRLVSYSSLGKNFTFVLTEPDRLTTSGIYRYVQHPSYTGMIVILACNAALLYRLDGALSCWIPSPWYQALRMFEWPFYISGLIMVGSGVWMRVRQEESMLRAKFGVDWEKWHAVTSRFIPWVF